MTASRLVSVLLLLQGRGLMTARTLAAELEVSERTIYRDVEALQAAGVPIFAQAGHQGGFDLVAGYRTRLTGMTRPEVEALFLIGLPGPAVDLGLGAVAAAARLKIASALPAELREGADRLQRRFLLDAPAWYREDEAVPHLPALADALWAGRGGRDRGGGRLGPGGGADRIVGPRRERAAPADEGIPAERAWREPHELRLRPGHLDPVRIAAEPDAVRAAVAGQPALHRYVNEAPQWLGPGRRRTGGL